jgi:carboxymethylenebutenolidase
MLITEETVEVVTPTGPMRVLILRPKDESKTWPAIIQYSEIFQLTGPVRRTGQILAGHGFIVALPEVYHELLPAGTVLTYTPEDTARGNACKAAKEVSAWDDDTAALVAFLLGYVHCSGSLGSAGTCLGGGLAFRAALNPAIRATVCWYATDLHKNALGKSGDDSIARCAEIKGELVMIYGRQDPHVPLEGRQLVHAALSASGVNFEWLEVNGAHAFLRDENSFGRYDPELALMTYQVRAGPAQRLCTAGGRMRMHSEAHCLPTCACSHSPNPLLSPTCPPPSAGHSQVPQVPLEDPCSKCSSQQCCHWPLHNLNSP